MTLEDLAEYTRQTCLLDPEKLILAGVSGGADSLCLLDALHRLGYQLAAAHFDHQLRPGSSVEADRVAEMSRERSIPFYPGSGDVRAEAEQHHLSLEEAARKARYRFLFDQANRLGAQAVAVGHTADDQCETVLMHFLRGSGLAGLRGMRPRSVQPEWGAAIPLVRPLLETWRAETQAYCQEQGLDFLSDPTNQQVDFFRNRLRLEVIPYLEQYNPRLKPALLRMAEILAGDEEILDGAAEYEWAKTAVNSGPGYTTLSAAELHRLPKGLQRILVRQAIQRLVPGLRDIDFDTSESLLSASSAGGLRHPLEITGGIWARTEGAWLHIYREGQALPDDAWPQLVTPSQVLLKIPGSLQLANSWQMTAEVCQPDNPLEVARHASEYEAWLDGSLLDASAWQQGLVVRALQPGDRLQPLGMPNGTIKVSDLFINEKIPQRARQRWPLVASGEQILWVVGLRTAAFAAVTPQTRRAVHLLVNTEK